MTFPHPSSQAPLATAKATSELTRLHLEIEELKQNLQFLSLQTESRLSGQSQRRRKLRPHEYTNDLSQSTSSTASTCSKDAEKNSASFLSPQGMMCVAQSLTGPAESPGRSKYFGADREDAVKYRELEGRSWLSSVDECGDDDHNINIFCNKTHATNEAPHYHHKREALPKCSAPTGNPTATQVPTLPSCKKIGPTSWLVDARQAAELELAVKELEVELVLWRGSGVCDLR